MKYFKGTLSLLAFAVGVVSGSAMAGLVTISAAGISFLLAVSGGLATFGSQLGIRALQISPSAARAFGAVSLIIGAGLGVHGQWLTAFTATHVWANPLLHWIGIAGILMGYAGRNPAVALPAPAAAARLDLPPPDER